MSDFADALFADLTDTPSDDPGPAFYPGSRHKIPDKPVPLAERVLAAAPDKPWDRNPRRIMVHGVEVEFFTIGALAEALNRKPVTIRSWETKGIMPKARYRTGGEVKRRLYSRRQVEGLIALCAKHGILDFAARPDTIPPEFTDDVITLWREDL